MPPTQPHDLDAARRILGREDVDPLALRIMQMMKSHAGMMEQTKPSPAEACVMDYEAAERIVAAVLVGGE